MLSQISLIAFIQGKVTSTSSTVTITWCQESEHFPGKILRFSRSGRSFRIFIGDQLQVLSVFSFKKNWRVWGHIIGASNAWETLRNKVIRRFKIGVYLHLNNEFVHMIQMELIDMLQFWKIQLQSIINIMKWLIFAACFSPLNNFVL